MRGFRQTADARKKPEELHDKVFNYHRYENSAERRTDGRPMTLLWACDAERDKNAAMQALRHHPTKTLGELDMEQDRDEARMPVGAGSPLWVANQLRDHVAGRLAPRAS